MGKFKDSNIGNGTNGQVQVSLEQNSYSDKIKNLNHLPTGDAQLKHIFANRTGHLPDTPQNRHIITALTNNSSNLLGIDKYGNEWYAQIISDGSQLWATTRNQTINNAGKNDTPRSWDNETGLSNNPKKNNAWRKKHE